MPADKQTSQSQAERQSSNVGPARPPAIALPKGGGAIRGIGKKFAANPVTGTGSLSEPIATNSGRTGFGAQLSLSYDSGTGNGPFGFGWYLSLPSITHKTDKGLVAWGSRECRSGRTMLRLMKASTKPRTVWERLERPLLRAAGVPIELHLPVVPN